MIYTLDYRTEREYAIHYVRCLNGLLKLTDREVEVLAALLLEKSRLKPELPEYYMYKLLFSTETRKEIADSLEMSAQNFGNILTQLHKKRVLGKSDAGTFTLPGVELENEIELKFRYVGDTEHNSEDSEG